MQLNVEMTDVQFKECTTKVKAMADVRPLAVDDVDSIIRAFHRNVKLGENKPLLQDLTAEEQQTLEKKEKELGAEPEKRKLDEQADQDASLERAKKIARTVTGAAA